jgi:hypothetical protein
MSNKRNLKSYILLPKFQLVFVSLNACVLMSTCFFAYFTVHKSFENLRSIGERMNLSNSSGYMKFIQAQEVMFADSMALYVLIALGVSLIITIILSHKVAGPVYRLKKYFEEFDRDNPRDLSFRKGDFFNDIPEIVNKNFKKES